MTRWLTLEDWMMAFLVAAAVGALSWAMWYSYSYPCKRHESYHCIQTCCQHIGDIPIYISHEETRTRCEE